MSITYERRELAERLYVAAFIKSAELGGLNRGEAEALAKGCIDGALIFAEVEMLHPGILPNDSEAWNRIRKLCFPEEQPK